MDTVCGAAAVYRGVYRTPRPNAPSEHISLNPTPCKNYTLEIHKPLTLNPLTSSSRFHVFSVCALGVFSCCSHGGSVFVRESRTRVCKVSWALLDSGLHAGWDDEAHFRFLYIKQQFQAPSRFWGFESRMSVINWEGLGLSVEGMIL